MGDRPRFHRSSGFSLLLRLSTLVAALCVLCVSSRASAASLPVPMCGERNESIAAPPIFRAYEAGQLKASPCHSEELKLGKSLPMAPERSLIQERPERVLGFGALLIAQSAAARVDITAQAAELERPGFVESLFRPPRA